ncbi:MAG: elongation factor P [Smithellaceae bacterium]|nr:elongation factor P [Smithellaceae bacterium]
MYNASDLKKGLRLKIDNEPHVVVEFNFVKPGKGQALYRTRLRNMITGSQFERSFRSVDSFEQADMQEKKMQFLYLEEDKYCFMDVESYEQVFLNADQVGDGKNYLIDNLEVEILFFEDRPLGITLPNFIDIVVAEAEPWAKGDSVSGNTKPIKLPTGHQIMVPPFIETGDRIRVDTRSGEYLTRVK